MFQPPIFREDRIEVMHGMMRQHSFVTLVTSQHGGIVADHIPMTIHEDLSANGTLRGHIARGNPLCRDTDAVLDALIIFQGPHSYVSPGWYPSKKEHGKAVPTWNYVVVQARGKLRLTRDADWLLDHLADLSGRHESGREKPWLLSDAPDNYIARQLKGIVGLQMEIDSLHGIWKVSQNKDQNDRAGVREGLLNEPSANAVAIAACVSQTQD